MSSLAQLTAVWTIGGGAKRVTAGLTFRHSSSVTQQGVDWGNAELDDLVQAGFDGWSGSPNLRASFGNDISLIRCEAFAYDIEVNPNVTPTNPSPQRKVPTLGPRMSSGSPVTGSLATTSSPPQVACVASFYTPLISRRGRGRCYLPPLTEQAVNANGSIDGSTLAQLRTAFNDWVIGMQNSAVPPLQVTQVVNTLYGVGQTETFEEVVSRVVKDRVDTQRRRLPREVV